MSDTLISIIAVLAVPFGIPVVAIVTSHRTKMARLRLQAENGASRQAEERIAALEDRIRVLERIVTDRGFGLANEIEALRGTGAPFEDRAKAFQ